MENEYNISEQLGELRAKLEKTETARKMCEERFRAIAESTVDAL